MRDACDIDGKAALTHRASAEDKIAFLRVAIELDGPQHLANTAEYRRDRRKDRLLQEHGYLVLRFLAEDLALDLDGVLDAVLRVVATRRQPFDSARHLP